MLAAYRHWRDYRRAVRTTADQLVAEYGEAAWAKVRRHEWRKGITNEEWDFNRRVTDAVGRRLGVDWNSDPATPHLE